MHSSAKRIAGSLLAAAVASDGNPLAARFRRGRASRPRSSAWSPPVCSSSRRLAMSRAADLPCFWMSKGPAGTVLGRDPRP